MTLENTDSMEQHLLESILETCEFTEELPEEMTTTAPLIGPDSPLGLDSLDAVEIIAMIQSRYGVRITSRETSVEVLNSLQSIAGYIRANATV